jgi:hypothetical protein
MENDSMIKRRLLFIGFALFGLLACDVFTQPLFQSSTPTVPAGEITWDCGDTQPARQDIDESLQHSERFFSAFGWERSYTVMEYQVRVTWSSDEFGAVANFDHIIFCDVTDSVLDEYFTAATLDIIMENYDEHDLQKECRSNGKRLYEFKAKKYGGDYDARFWVEIVDGNHILETLLVFPIEEQNNLNIYSRRIMPELSSCN